MRSFTSKFITILLLTLIINGAHGEDKSPSSYDLAIKALNNGDCFTAAIELEKYKIEAKSLINSYPSFLALIDKQISNCKNNQGEGRLVVSGARPGLNVKGSIKNDKLQQTTIQGASQAVRFPGL